MKTLRNLSVAVVLLLVSCFSAWSKITLPSLFTDAMVLQQKSEVLFWGKSDSKQNITITTSWNNKQYVFKANESGSWKTKVQTPKFGGPYTINIFDGETVTLKNILIGDVWVCSGQSNMEMPLAGWGKINNYQEEIRNANYPNIRLLQVEHVTSNEPLDNAKIVNNKGWQVCNPENIAEFSSVAYFFAREINKKTNVPIGLIHTSWGGTIVEAWTSGESLSTTADFKEEVSELRKFSYNEMKANFDSKTKIWTKTAFEKDKGFVNGQERWVSSDFDDLKWATMNLPEPFENTLLGNFDGVVWYRKTVSIPTSMAGKDLLLSLGPIDDFDITYFNGQKIAEGAGYNVPRKYTIPGSLVKAGKNTIAVRVFDTGGGGGIYDKNSKITLSLGSQEISLVGEWKYNIGLHLNELPPYPTPIDGPNRPTVLYNAMINPFINFKIKGAIWYQGESNAERAEQYKRLFPLLIKDWRNKWNIGDFPFYFVQLANYMKKDEIPPQKSDWALLREAQYQTLALPNTGMAVTIDIGDAQDIHPKNKQDVGKRLSLIALNKDYKLKDEFSGPVFKEQKIATNKVILSFNHDNGLKINGEKLEGFAIAGEDKKFYWAAAKIENGKVILTSEKVPNPVAVRYGWGNNPSTNLTNKSNLPASPFRTDTW